MADKKPPAKSRAKRTPAVRKPRAPSRRKTPAAPPSEPETHIAAADDNEAFATSPLGVLLGVAQDEAMPIALRVQAAKAALPFVHRRRAGEKPEPGEEDRPVHERELERLLAAPEASESDEADIDEAGSDEADDPDEAAS